MNAEEIIGINYHSEQYLTKVFRGDNNVIVDSKILKKISKYNLQRKDDLMGIIKALCKSKEGDTLPKAHNNNYLKKINTSKKYKAQIQSKYDVDDNDIVMQYRPSGKLRLIWKYKPSSNNITILDCSQRGNLEKKLW